MSCTGIFFWCIVVKIYLKKKCWRHVSFLEYTILVTISSFLVAPPPHP
jgi:hypothetical protein